MSTSCNIAYNRDGNNAGRLFLIVIFIVFVFVVVVVVAVVVVFLFGVTVAAQAVAAVLIAVGTNVGEAILKTSSVDYTNTCLSVLSFLCWWQLGCVFSFVNYYDCVQPGGARYPHKQKRQLCVI